MSERNNMNNLPPPNQPKKETIIDVLKNEHRKIRSDIFHPIHIVASAVGLSLLLSVALKDREETTPDLRPVDHLEEFQAFSDCIFESPQIENIGNLSLRLIDPSYTLSDEADKRIEQCRDKNPLP